MSIEPLVRIVLIGATSRRRAALEALQDAGFMHVDGLDALMRAQTRAGIAGGERARQALRYLAATPRIRAQARSGGSFDVDAFVSEVLANRDERRRLSDRKEALAKRIENVAPWGDFALPDSPDALGGRRLWFYELSARDLGKLRSLSLPWTIAHRAGGRAHVVVLSTGEPAPTMLPAPRRHIGARRLAALIAERDALELSLDEADSQREALTRRAGLLARHLAAADDRDALRLAESLSAEQDGVFSLVGWAPAARESDVVAVAEREGLVALVDRSADPSEAPTLLKPAPPVAGGADLMRLYQIPSARAWDPSGVLFFSFAAFFALIVSDAGYSALLLAILALAWGRLGQSPPLRRLRSVWLASAALSLAWGVMVGSYFGIGPPTPALAALKVISIDDYDSMMALSIYVGAAHIAVANVGAAMAARRLSDALGKIGWIAATGGGLLLWRGGSDWTAIGYGALATGLALVALSAGGALKGLVALTSVTRLFADILSYLRLFALGLAGSSLAVAFNRLAEDVRDASPAFGLFAASLILIIGHGLNLALGIMGGVVHGLRLNFIEFFGWALSEEGRAFVPFARRERDGS